MIVTGDVELSGGAYTTDPRFKQYKVGEKVKAQANDSSKIQTWRIVWHDEYGTKVELL